MKRLLGLVLIILLLTNTTTIYAVYDTTKVSTQINGIRYTIQGTRLLGNGKELTNLTSLTYKDEKTEITKEMMKTLLITDMASNEQEGHPFVYLIGIVFKPSIIDPNDTSNYKYMKLEIGTPYMVLISYNVDHTKAYTNLPTGNLFMEATLKLLSLWDYPYNITWIDDPDQSETWDTVYNFAARVVHPKIIISKTKTHIAYFLTQDTPDKIATKDHIKVFRFDTDRTLPPDQKFREEFYVPFVWINNLGKSYDKNFQTRLDQFYIKEPFENEITVYNFGNKISVAATLDIQTWQFPKVKETYWRKTSEIKIEDD